MYMSQVKLACEQFGCTVVNISTVRVRPLEGAGNIGDGGAAS